MSVRLDAVIGSKENNFDFIRFLAATLVILSHSFQLSGLTEIEPMIVFSKHYLSLGTFSVIVFFVISGFLIARSYDNSGSLKSYVFARVLRIYPALIVTVLLTVLVLGPLLTNLSIQAYFSDSKTMRYLLNCFSQRMYFHLPGVFIKNVITVVNGPLWSLPFELVCYVMIIMFGELIKKRFLRAIVVLGIILCMCYFIDIHAWKNIIRFMFFFACGSIFYVFRSRIVLNKCVAALCIVILLSVIYLNLHRHVKDAILGLTLSYVILTFSYIKSSLNHFAKHGDFSYGLYVLAWPVQQLFVQFVPGLNHYFNFILSFAVTLVLAYASWHLIEKRFLKLKARFR